MGFHTVCNKRDTVLLLTALFPTIWTNEHLWSSLKSSCFVVSIIVKSPLLYFSWEIIYIMQSDCLWSAASFPLKEERASSDKRRHILETATKLDNFCREQIFFFSCQSEFKGRNHSTFGRQFCFSKGKQHWVGIVAILFFLR